MKTKAITTVLRTAQRDGQIVRLRDYSDSGLWVSGYVVGLSDEFVVLHYVDLRQINLDGYLAVRRDTLRSARLRDENDDFLHRALQAKGFASSAPQNIVLDDMPALLSSVDAHFPLLYVELDGKDFVYVGRVARLTARSVFLRQIAPSAHWSRVKKHRFSDITRIGFGGGYEDALWRVSEQHRRLAAASAPTDGTTSLSENDQ